MTNFFTGGRRFFALIAFVLLFARFAFADGEICSHLFSSNQDPVRQMFLDHIRGENLKNSSDRIMHRNYKESSSHIEILKAVFGVVFGKNAYVPPIEEMFEKYENYMKMLVRAKIISEKDVLHPKKVYKTSQGNYKFVDYRDPLPPGAKLVNEELPVEFYIRMIRDGFFPISGPELFEHDLAHLTGFIANPKYMAKLKRYTERLNKLRYPARAAREFFINESLVVLRADKKEELINSLLLTEKMRANLDSVSIKEMMDYINTLPPSALENTVRHLMQNYDIYFNSMGGATRDPYNGYRHFGQSREVSPVRALIFYTTNTKMLARLQWVLIRLSDITMDDWFDAVETPKLDKNSPIGRLFANEEAWGSDMPVYKAFSRSHQY